MTIPEGYILATGQKVPASSYKLTGDDAPVFIYVVKKQSSTDIPEVSEKDSLQLVEFIDKTTNEVVKEVSKAGKVGDTVTLDVTVPAGYVLAQGQILPASSYKLTGDDAPVIVYVIKKQNNTDTPEVSEKDSLQLVEFVDRTTNEVVKEVGKAGKIGDTVTLNVSLPKGYVLAQGQTLPASSYKLTGDDRPVIVYVTKRQNVPPVIEKDSSQTVKFVDKSTNKVVKEVSKGGKIGDIVTLDVTIPAGYNLAIGQKAPLSTYKLTGNDKPIIIYLTKYHNDSDTVIPKKEVHNNSESKKDTVKREKSVFSANGIKVRDRLINKSVKHNELLNNRSGKVSYNQISANKQFLPQTGDSKHEIMLEILGSVLLGTGFALLNLFDKKRKQ